MNQSLVVITGAGSGIGAACARAFSQEGHPLLLIGRNIEKLQQLTLPNTICSEADVSNLKLLQSCVDNAQNQYGPVDAIINNAGTLMLGHLWDQNPAEWETMIDVNITGVLNGMRTVLKSMMERRHGTIINVGSVAAVHNYDNHDIYGGTKAAIRYITENLRKELSAYNVRCITIEPGTVDTEIILHTTASQLRENYIRDKKNMRALLSPEDIADVILFSYKQPPHVCIRELVVCPTEQKR